MNCNAVHQVSPLSRLEVLLGRVRRLKPPVNKVLSLSGLQLSYRTHFYQPLSEFFIDIYSYSFVAQYPLLKNLRTKK
jgi:hypothetical protein